MPRDARERNQPWLALGALAFVAGCVHTPYVMPPPEGPTLGTAAEWTATIEHEEGRPSHVERDALRAEAHAVCPGSPSEGAAAMAPTRRGCILSVSPEREIAALEALLRQTPRDHPDWILIVDRIAFTAFSLELRAFRGCVALTAAEPRDRSSLASLRDELAFEKRNLELARKKSAEACETLARDPRDPGRAPCPFRAERPKEPPAAVCMEAPRCQAPSVSPLGCEAP